MFRGHVMGIPADYKDSDYMDKVPTLTAVLMLSLPKEQLALQGVCWRSWEKPGPSRGQTN
jgi:hypothetical protein